MGPHGQRKHDRARARRRDVSEDRPMKPREPWYASTSFWTGPFLIGLALLVAVGGGIAWYILGGFPRDHDRYGSVSVPGQQILQLPAGDVRVNHENDATGSGDSRSIQDRPQGLAVRVVPVGGGGELEVKDVPSWLFVSIKGDRGHEPFGKLEIPRAGRYRIQTSHDEAPGLDTAVASRSASATRSGPEITLGQRPWSPVDSALLSAILAGLAAFLAVILLTLPARLITRS
jgi:hypothetical protein